MKAARTLLANLYVSKNNTETDNHNNNNNNGHMILEKDCLARTTILKWTITTGQIASKKTKWPNMDGCMAKKANVVPDAKLAANFC